ncbi:hypothetical protein [Rubritalea tangerina]|uniref:hypothetical protein n=1 Tax=Rubritalea tangerina TaxID=430798 RepID=UPI00360C06AF
MSARISGRAMPASKRISASHSASSAEKSTNSCWTMCPLAEVARRRPNKNE